MKILLIAPTQTAVYGKPIAVYPPLGLLYIGACLIQAGYQVRLIDQDAEKLWDEKLITEIRLLQPDIIGITAVTPTYPAAVRLARKIKHNLNVKIVFGGIHATILPEDVISDNAVDFVVRGEGEQTVVELMNAISQKSVDFSSIQGLVWKNDGSIKINPPRLPIENLDTLPFPAWQLIPRLENYHPPDALNMPLITLMTTRGCSAVCDFCSTRTIFGKKVRMHSAAYIMDQIKYLQSRYKIKEIHIADDVFTINKKRVIQICDEIQKSGLKLTFYFMNGLRADQVDEEILGHLKQVGFQNVAFGVETADDIMRDGVNKNLSLEQVKSAIQLAKKTGFSSWLFFIIGLWGETSDTAKNTISFVKSMQPDYVKFFILKPYPGTAIYDFLEEHKCILTKDWEKYGLYNDPVHCLPTMTPEEMKYWFRRANREFYLGPGRIFKQLWQMRSWTQIKANLSALSVLRYHFFDK